MKGRPFNKIIFILLVLPFYLFAQPVSQSKDIAGLWKGTLYNDSTQKYIPFEIAISEDNGKLSGYSYIVFDIDGNKEMGVKRIRMKRKDDDLTIEDIEIIANTYKVPPPRGVRFRSTVSFSRNDTAKLLTGSWSTNPTREYGQNNGSIQLHQAIDYTPQPLFQELVRLKLDQDLSFVKNQRKPTPDIAITAPKLPAAVASQPSDSGNLAEVAALPPQKKIEGVIDDAQPAAKAAKQLVSKPVAYTSDVAMTAIPEKIAEKLVVTDLTVIKNRPSRELFNLPGRKRKTISPLTAKNKEVFISPRDKQKEEYLVALNKAKTIVPPPVASKTEPVATTKEPAKKPAAIKKPDAIAPPVAINKPATAPVVKEPVKPANNPAAVVIAPAEQKKESFAVNANPANLNAAAEVSTRTMKNEQSVFYESDSLVLTLYDNGEVDGDTVSVLMNGQIIFARQGLTTKANTKTIYIDKTMPDSISMIMYAENLGSIPPNTGLLIIMDGEKRYEVRFSADLQTNAAILLRRRKKEN